jgi:regulator of sigma E protease
MVRVVQQSSGEPLEFTVLRGVNRITLVATPGDTAQRHPVTGEERTIGFLGIGEPRPLRNDRWGFVGGIVEGGRRVKSDSKLILVTLKGLITGRVSARELGGPVLIGQISGQVARRGLVALFSFMALFSVNLAILNLLPIPVLDGGQLVFLLIEGIRGKPMPLELRVRFSQFGLVILLGIMVLALTNDLLRVFGG